ncbi:hypothetical protein ACFQHW_04590 [Lapidilactobacillus achengensis]|uniref:Lipoprotein n=1 Tax=Lapidilactobacillus achengensis TaxID=2486000 RepID=A0ABW1UMC9_9LACO|nr:hypothetical protein [Lapidilactobacillus achengensis]
MHKKSRWLVVVGLLITLVVVGISVQVNRPNKRDHQSVDSSQKSASNSSSSKLVSGSKFVNNPEGNHYIDLYNQIYTSTIKGQANSKEDFANARWQALDLTSVETMSRSKAEVFFYDSLLVIRYPNKTETAGFVISKVTPIKKKSGISGYEFELQPTTEPGGDLFATGRIQLINDAYRAVKLVDPDNLLKLGQVTLLYETDSQDS